MNRGQASDAAAMVEHLRQLVRAMVDPRQSESARAGHARTVADHGSDLARAFEVAVSVTSGSVVMDTLRAEGGGRGAVEARERIATRDQLGEMRALLSAPQPSQVVGALPTGLEGAAPLIKVYGTRWGGPDGRGSNGVTPLVPSMPALGAGVVNATLPLTDDEGTQMVIGAASEEQWDYGQTWANLSRQLIDFAGPAAAALIDRILIDIADVAAEEFVVSALEDAATESASADVDVAEAAAGAAGRGPCSFLLCPPALWPAVRREVAQSWQLGPSPVPIVSAGATRVTLVGPDAFELLVGEPQMFEGLEPRVFGGTVSVQRPFKLVLRNPAALVMTSTTV